MQASNAPHDMAVAEANNLKGQLISSLREVEARGLLAEVVSGIPKHVVDRVLVQSGLLKLQH